MNLIANYISYFKRLKLTANQLLFFTCCYITLILNLPFLAKAVNIITALENYSYSFK